MSIPSAASRSAAGGSSLREVDSGPGEYALGGAGCAPGFWIGLGAPWRDALEFGWWRAACSAGRICEAGADCCIMLLSGVRLTLGLHELGAGACFSFLTTAGPR